MLLSVKQMWDFGISWMAKKICVYICWKYEMDLMYLPKEDSLLFLTPTWMCNILMFCFCFPKTVIAFDGSVGASCFSSGTNEHFKPPTSSFMMTSWTLTPSYRFVLLQYANLIVCVRSTLTDACFCPLALFIHWEKYSDQPLRLSVIMIKSEAA